MDWPLTVPLLRSELILVLKLPVDADGSVDWFPTESLFLIELNLAKLPGF